MLDCGSEKSIDLIQQMSFVKGALSVENGRKRVWTTSNDDPQILNSNMSVVTGLKVLILGSQERLTDRQ
jgi:hypothetical protein